MWPLEGRGGREWVRVGALSVERWVAAGRGLTLAGRQAVPVEARDDPAGLLPLLAALYPVPPGAKVGLVLESAWLPLLLADTGGTLWSRAQVELLVRHRMEALYGDGPEGLAGWTWRVDHRIGARHALGYGLAPAVKQALVAAGEGVGINWHELVPAFAWGWQRLREARRPSTEAAWWLWPEQDRSVLARLEDGQVTGLNTAVEPCAEPAQVERAVGAEAVRQGGRDQDPVIAASWLATPHPVLSRQRLTWVSITGPEEPGPAPLVLGKETS